MKVKKALTCFMAAASIAAVGLLASSCKFSSDEGNSALIQQILLQQQNTSANLAQKIAAANGSLDLGGAIYAENVYLDKENFTLKNGNLGGKILTVTKSGVVLENISNAKIVVDESVGDGDFTMKGCTNVVKLTVNGGGANSIHIADSEVKSLAARKANVRVVLEGSASVASAEVKADGIKLEGNSSSKIEKVSVSKTVKTITIQGGKIEKVITQAVVSIKIASSDTKIDTVKSSSIVKIEKDEGVEFENPEILEFENIMDEYESVKGDKISESGEEEEVEEPELSEEEERELIPETIELIPLEWNGGLKLKFTNVELSPEWSNRDDVIWINVDGVNIEMGTPDEEFYFPFVNPGEEVTVQIIHEVDIKDDNGIRTMKYNKAASPKVKITPAGGLGKLAVSGELEYTADEYGILNITGIPSVEPADLEWAIQFDIAEGTDWDDGNWRGQVTVPGERLPGKANYYLDGWTEFKDSIDHGFIAPQLIYYWTDSVGHRHEYRADLGSYSWSKFDYKLKSYDKMLSDGVVELPINIFVTDTDDGLLIAAMDRSGENPYRFLTTSSNDQLRLHIDDKLVSIIDGNWGGDLKYFTNYPFVTPGKEIKIKLDHYQEDWNRQGEIIKTRIIESGEINYTPKTGRGEISCGEFEFVVDEEGYGMVTVTKTPTITPALREGEKWNLFFNFYDVKNGERMWYGEIHIPKEYAEDGIPCNVYDSAKGYVNNFSGFDSGIVEPYIVYCVGNEDGSISEFRSYCFSDAILRNVKLKSKNQVIAALGEDFSGFGN